MEFILGTFGLFMLVLFYMASKPCRHKEERVLSVYINGKSSKEIRECMDCRRKRIVRTKE